MIDKLQRGLDKLLKDPENYQLYNEIGVVLYQMKDWDLAETYFRRAYRLNIGNIDVLYNYAVILHKQFKYDKAVSVYQEYLSLVEEDDNVRIKLGECFYLLGEYASAKKVLGINED